VYSAFLDAQGVDAYLTRPDWYVFGAVQADRLADLVDELGELLRVRVRPAVSA
jgi:3-(3-hydroxy-phenyl)propionate hydroxylase